ncbi:MAG: extracellular solute-binding protein, partial [Nanoarchaeota archaeon]|nr:extracellular solute-binding protein [Nanoarchaeota archaeon]
MITSYESFIASDEKKAPIEIQYIQKGISGNQQYEKEFNEALIQGNGPDIITLNNTWLPRYKNKIYPLDGGAKTAQEYQRKFVDVVSSDFLEGNKIYAMPLSLDTLALYYNIDILNSAGIFDPPRTWDEFNEAVRKLTVRDEKGNIKRAGAAIGT